MGRIFHSLYFLLTRHRIFLVFFMVIIAAFVAVSVSNLNVNEDFTSVFPQVKDADKFRFVLKNSSASNKIIVCFSTSDTANPAKTENLVRIADSFCDSILFSHQDQIREIKYVMGGEEMKAVFEFIHQNLPIFLEPEDYKKLTEKLTDSAVRTELTGDLQTLLSPAGIVLKQFLMSDPLHFTSIPIEKLNRFQTGENYVIEKNRIFSKSRNDLFAFISVCDPGNTRAMSRLAERLEKTAASVSDPSVRMEYFGTPIVSAANADRIKKDLILTLSLSVLFLFLVLGYYFRNYFASLILLTPVVIGGALALAILFLIKGSISAISLGLGSVLLGIGIDFSLHLYNHYRESGSVKELYDSLAKPIIVGAITTSAAFMCLMLIKSPGLQDFGLFAALSVICTALAALIVLPLVLVPVNKKNRQPRTGTILRFITSYEFHKNRYLLYSIIVLTVIFSFTSRSVRFSGNLMDLNYMPENLKKAESRFIEKSVLSGSQVMLVTSGSNIDEALTNNEKISGTIDRLRKSSVINGYFYVNDLMPSEEQQREKIEKWNLFWKTNKDTFLDSFISAGKDIGFRNDSFGKFIKLLEKNFNPVPASEFHEIRKLLLQDYLIESDKQAAVITLLKTAKENKQVVRESLSGFENTYFFDRQGFSEQMLTGIQSQFTRLLLYSSLLVFILQLVSFGRIELALVTFIPLVISWLWTIGIMGILRIPFNFFNLMISTFIFGLADDYTIFMTEGHQQRFQTDRDNVTGFKRSTLLSALTAIAGIGVLIFAGHPALRSIALVTVIGLTSAVIVTFTVQPVLLNFLTHYQGRKRMLPVTLYNYFFSLASLFYFFVVSMTGVLLLPVLKVLPLSQRRRRHAVQTVIWFFSKTVVYMNMHIPKVLVNKPGDLFEKPRIIISNHQSSLDLVLLLMLHPKLVILANTRSWQNPFYGRLIRFAGFIRSDTGLGEAMTSIRQRISEGYSVIVFPEGTRSVDCSIKRFHKGAFYLADQLNLEIQPILIHGACQALNKKEFFLRRGRITLRFLDRINLKEGFYGTDHLQQAQGIVGMMREEFESMKLELENPDRMKFNLINRYIYRSPVLEWYLRIKLRLENNYHPIHEIVPREAVITDIGCGYGFMDVMLALTSGKRKITGFDYDEEKILTAQKCTEDLPNVKFILKDIAEQQLPASDVFLLMDVLHYMAKEKQIRLLQKCFTSLNTPGLIVIRDADADLKRRTMGTKLTEYFSTRSGFNKKRENLSFVSGRVIRKLSTDYGFNLKVIDNTKFTSNLIYILSR
jgi:1-acyl-sn-glycerol-3-phosphate acyltransferase